MHFRRINIGESMAGKGSSKKGKSKAEKQAMANAEIKSCLEAGASSSVMLVQEHCSEPASPPPSPMPNIEEKAPHEKNQDNIKKLHKRIKNLEHQVTIAHEHSQWACPGEIIATLGKSKTSEFSV